MNNPRTSIFFIIKTYFGRESYKKANDYFNEELRRINLQETLNFNRRCKNNNIIPRSLIQQPPLRTPEGFRIARSNAIRYLSAYIRDGYYNLRNSNNKIEHLRQEISEILPEYIIIDLENSINERKINYRTNKKNHFISKFNNLKNQHNIELPHQRNWIKNLSSHVLSDAEKSVLRKGLNYSIPNNKRNIPTFVASVEDAIENLSDISLENKTILRHQVCAAIRSSNNNHQNLNKEETRALNSLKNNSDIVIAPADKGCSVVILDKVDYKQKIQDHLSDSSTYQIQSSDPTPELRKIVNQFLKSLFDKKLLTNNQYQHLFARSSTIPLFYALIKIHKINNPIRPIVSFINSPSYNIAKFLSNLLTPSTNKSNHKLKNSLDAKLKLKNQIIPNSHLMVSFDVKSLFTCIPQEYAIECVKNFLNNNQDIYERTRLNSQEILKLIEICLNSTSFAYDNNIYQQIKGTPMGSPVSVVIAEIVMQHIETNILSQNDNIIFLFWFRYVDDILACILKIQEEQSLNFVNSINANV